MAQLYFKFSTMESGKSLDLLKSVYNYETQGKKVLVFTSQVDTRNGEIPEDAKEWLIYTRIGLQRHAWLIERVDAFQMAKEFKPDCVFVDEAQFIKEEYIIALSDIVDELHIPVICYGLKNDFLNNFFPGSGPLLLYADKIEELKTVCVYCNHKATMNMREVDGEPSFDGDQICVDKNEDKDKKKVRYVPVCRSCYKKFKKIYLLKKKSAA